MPKTVYLPAVVLSLFCISLTVAAQSGPVESHPDGPIDVKEKKSSDKAPAPPKAKRSFKLRTGSREFEIIPSFAPIQPTFLSGIKEYNTDGRRMMLFNLRFGRTIGTKGPVTYQYFFEVTPLAVAFNNEVRNPAFRSPAETPRVARTVRTTSYGAGFQPANFRFVFLPNRRIKPFAQVGAGMIFFNRKMPVPEATFYNLTGDFGGGVHIITNPERRNRAITLGYRYFHISNANTSKFNPGYNANVFYMGYSFSR